MSIFLLDQLHENGKTSVEDWFNDSDTFNVVWKKTATTDNFEMYSNIFQNLRFWVTLVFIFAICLPTEQRFKLQNQKQSLLNILEAWFKLMRCDSQGLCSQVSDLIPNTTRMPRSFHKAVNVMLLF